MRPAVPALTILAALAAPLPAAAQSDDGARHEWGERQTSYPPAFDAQFRAPLEATAPNLSTEAIAGGFVHPWAVAVLPDGMGYLVTERAGPVRLVRADGTVSDPIDGFPDVHAEGQGGMLDLKLGPDFAQDRVVYVTYAKETGETDGGEVLSATAAGRGTLSEDMSALEGFEDIWVQEPSAPEAMHYGSRIVFDGEGHAFITTGERYAFQNRPRAQQLGATWGKVARVNLDGSIPEDNPFAGREDADPSIWSYGHRNIQGAAMRDGRLLSIEHGPQGGDELNVPAAGANYGWPLVSYGRRYDREGGAPVGTGMARMEGTEQPLYFWDPVIAPSDMVIYDGAMFEEWQGDALISALVAGGLVRLAFGDDGLVSAEERLLPDLGRTRDVAVDEDGSLLVLTDGNADGRLVRVTMP